MIDWARVREVREEIGEDDFAEVIELFLEEADEVVAKITAGIDADQIEEALHFLKGSALNLGFRMLADLCQAGEKAAASGTADTVDLKEIATTYQRSKEDYAAGRGVEDAA